MKCYYYISRSVRYAFSNWNKSTIGLNVNLNAIVFIVFVFPMCWFLQRYGLRHMLLLCTGLTFIGTFSRVFSSDVDSIYKTCFTISAQFCSIVNGISYTAIMAVPVVSATWFPTNERTTATATCIALNIIGNAVSSLIGPLVVPDVTDNDFPIATSNLSNGLDHFQLTQEKENFSTKSQANQYEINRNGIRRCIQNYMIGQAVVSGLILLAVVIHFPSKPETPPTASTAIETVPRPLISSVKTAMSNKNVLYIIASSSGLGIQFLWQGILTLNYGPVGVNQQDCGKMAVASGIICSIIGVWTALYIGK